MRIYLDLDGVLANFTEGACKLFGVDYPEGVVLLDDYWLDAQIDWDKQHGEMHSIEFWENLDPFPWAMELAHLCERYDPNYTILTRVMTSPECLFGKYRWIEKYLGRQENFIMIRGDKDLCGGFKTDVLIDDHSENIAKWKNRGGTGYRWLHATRGTPSYVIDGRLREVSEIFENILLHEVLEVC